MFITAATLFWPTIQLRSPRPCSCCCDIRNCVAATKKPPPRPQPATTGQRSASASVQSCSRWRKRNRLRYAPFPGAGRKEKPKNREKEEFLAIGDHAKITAILAMWGLFTALGKTKRTFRDLPKEARLLLIMIGILYLGAFLSPVWRGGAVVRCTDFSKVYIAWVLVFLLITTFDRLRRIIFIQAASVVVACAAAVIKGHNVPRLNSVLGGIYGNPNDLAFAIVLSLPFALAFMVAAKNAVVKAAWLGGMLIMAVTIFLTASRAGFIDLIISGSVALYFFGIKGKRPMLIVATGLVGVVVMGAFGGKLYDLFAAL